MGFFDMFGKADNGSVGQPASTPAAGPVEVNGAVQSMAAPEKLPAAAAAETLTVSSVTGWPIDNVYGYLHKNYEDKGFSDAMVKSDLAFRDLNMNIIRNHILMVFKEVNLKYEVMRQNLSANVEKCKGAGLLTVVEDVEKRISLIDAHVKVLKDLEEDFRNNAQEVSVPLQSYECGFLRGIATIALSGDSGMNLPSSPVAD